MIQTTLHNGKKYQPIQHYRRLRKQPTRQIMDASRRNLRFHCDHLMRHQLFSTQTDAANQSDRREAKSACLKAALDAGHPADSHPAWGCWLNVAVKRIGDETFRLCQSI